MTGKGTFRIDRRTVVPFLVALTIFCFGCESQPETGGSTKTTKKTYRTNGEQIYFTATTRSGSAISASGGMIIAGKYPSCARCHGKDGRGGKMRVTAYSIAASDITLAALTSGHHGYGGGSGEAATREHPPYRDSTIRRAITQGLDSGGTYLDPAMPRYNISGQDLNDLMKYLETL